MKLFLLLMLWVNVAGTYGEEAFTCDNTGEECPSKMCFYGIDHEHSCYRAGCDTKKQCAGRRHNECFITDGLHICCCTERGCAARYKGLSDCVDEPKNTTDTDELTTPVASETVEEQSNAVKVLPTSTEPQVDASSMEETEPSSTLEEEDDLMSAEETTVGATTREEQKKKGEQVEEDEEEQVGEEDEAAEEEETTTVAKKDTTLSALVVTTAKMGASFSTEPMDTTTTTEKTTTTTEKKTTTTEKTTSPSTTSTSTQTSTTTSERTTTFKATSPKTTATRTTTSYIPRTTRYTTTQTPPPTTTTAYLEQLRALPDMPHAPLREDPEEDSEEKSTTERKPLTTSRRTTTTTSVRTTTRATTTPVRIVPPMRKTPVNEPVRELEPARAEKSQFISPAVQSEDSENAQIHSKDTSDEETSIQEDPDVKPTTSLINVYEVTTLAVKNREVHEQWKAPVPWWAAVAVGFLVSVMIAWAVVFYLRKKKLREAEAAHRRSADKEAAVAAPLLKPSGVVEQ